MLKYLNTEAMYNNSKKYYPQALLIINNPIRFMLENRKQS